MGYRKYHSMYPSSNLTQNFFKVFNIGDRILYSDHKRRKIKLGKAPKDRGPIYHKLAIVLKVHSNGNICAHDQVLDTPVEVLATEAK
jgi:hypothetical protein